MTGLKKIGILVGGGPAPGINSVIGAATIRARLKGVEVVGLEDGFSWIMQGDTQHWRPLGIESVSRMHFRGGSTIGTSRANPTKDPQLLDNCVTSLVKMGVDGLITIGGDDTAFSALSLEKRANGRIRVLHVPKTIDNDLDLPPHVDTFGYQTARHVAVDILKNLMVDARTTSRWYFTILMGRKAGHLALGVGKAAGATITLIPEEFAHRPLRLRTIADTLAGSVLKRIAEGRTDGVAVIAEGVVLDIDPEDLQQLKDVERDAHGHVRISEIDIGGILKRAVNARLSELGVHATIVSKNIGYELRCADPIPFDMEYTRDLGYCAARYMLEGGNAALVSIQAGNFVPVPFSELYDPQTGRTRVRLVDVHSTRYAIAHRYMIRLRREDFQDEAVLGRIAQVAHLSVPQFREQFEYLLENEPPAIVLQQQGH